MHHGSALELHHRCGGAVGKLATMGGFRQDDGTMEPFYWRASDVVAYREKMQALAAKAALAHLGADHGAIYD